MGVSVAEWLLNFGVAGVVIVLLVTGALVPGFVFKELQRAFEKQADALIVERQRNADLQQMASTGARALDALARVAQEEQSRRDQLPRPGPSAGDRTTT